MEKIHEGFWSKKFNQCHKQFFLEKGIIKPSTLLLSKVQRRIWKITQGLWIDKNNHLHKVQHSMHPQEEANLIEEITYEYNKGVKSLPEVYQSVFSIPLQTIVKRSIQHKV